MYSAYISADVATFFDIGTDNVVIYKLTNEMDPNIYYAIEVDSKQANSYSNYYLMDDCEKISQLFNKLKDCGSEIITTPNDKYMFKLVGPKFYEVAKKKEDLIKGLRVECVYDESPIGKEYIDDISRLVLKEYEEVFGYYEQEGKGGFPVF
jgi:hypothetical protein